MIRNKENLKYFCQTEKNAYGVRSADMAHTAVNAVAIAMNIRWDQACRRLVEQAIDLGLMPADEKCVKAMLRSYGFVQQPRPDQSVTPVQLCREMAERCTDGQVAVVKTNRCMTAIVPGEPGQMPYMCRAAQFYPDYWVTEIWVRWCDGEDHSPVPRRKTGTRAKKEHEHRSESHNTYCFYQPNPRKNNIGDCVIRGVSAVLGITWAEAMEALAEMGQYSQVVVNESRYHYVILEQKGFTRVNDFGPGKEYPTGEEFCAIMAKRYQKGEPVFAQVGKHHVAAVMPEKLSDGTYRYRIYDSWDSSQEKFGEYWVREVREFPNAKQEPEPVKEDVKTPAVIEAGIRIVHPSFGEGTVKTVLASGIVEVEFPGMGVKLWTKKWLEDHCKTS